MREIIIELEGVSGFAEDKDEARRIRTATLMPALEREETVILDFSQVKYSTQSFVHALLGEVLHRFKEPVLEKLEFRHCTPQLKSLVQLVVDYSLGGFSGPSGKHAVRPANPVSKQIRKRRKPTKKRTNRT